MVIFLAVSVAAVAWEIAAILDSTRLPIVLLAESTASIAWEIAEVFSASMIGDVMSAIYLRFSTACETPRLLAISCIDAMWVFKI